MRCACAGHEPVGGVQRAQFGQGQVHHIALAVGGAIHIEVMQDHQLVVLGLVDIHFQYVRACFGRLGIGIQRVFRKIRDTATVRKIERVRAIDQPAVWILGEGQVTGRIVVGDGAGHCPSRWVCCCRRR